MSINYKFILNVFQCFPLLKNGEKLSDIEQILSPPPKRLSSPFPKHWTFNLYIDFDDNEERKKLNF